MYLIAKAHLVPKVTEHRGDQGPSGLLFLSSGVVRKEQGDRKILVMVLKINYSSVLIFITKR